MKTLNLEIKRLVQVRIATGEDILEDRNRLTGMRNPKHQEHEECHGKAACPQ